MLSTMPDGEGIESRPSEFSSVEGKLMSRLNGLQTNGNGFTNSQRFTHRNRTHWGFTNNFTPWKRRSQNEIAEYRLHPVPTSFLHSPNSLFLSISISYSCVLKLVSLNYIIDSPNLPIDHELGWFLPVETLHPIISFSRLGLQSPLVGDWAKESYYALDR